MDDNREYPSIWVAIGRFMDQHELHRLFDRERQRMHCHNRSIEKYRTMQESQEHSKAMQQALATMRPWRFWPPRSRSPPTGDALPPAPLCDSYAHPLLCLKGLNEFIYTERCSDLIKSKIMEESKEEKEKDESVDKDGFLEGLGTIALLVNSKSPAMSFRSDPL
jgi:hypothetical protein